MGLPVFVHCHRPGKGRQAGRAHQMRGDVLRGLSFCQSVQNGLCQAGLNAGSAAIGGAQQQALVLDQQCPAVRGHGQGKVVRTQVDDGIGVRPAVEPGLHQTLLRYQNADPAAAFAAECEEQVLDVLRQFVLELVGQGAGQFPLAAGRRLHPAAQHPFSRHEQMQLAVRRQVADAAPMDTTAARGIGHEPFEMAVLVAPDGDRLAHAVPVLRWMVWMRPCSSRCSRAR